MHSRWRHLLIAACLLSFVLWLGAFNATKARLLVVHSKGPDTAWVQAMDAGMRQALDANRRPVSVSWMYLDLTAPTAANRLNQVQASLQRMVEQVDPDVLIVVDDEANGLVAAMGLAGRVGRILYVSLDSPPAHYGYSGLTQVSGIAETLPLDAIREAATSLFADRQPRAAVIGLDTSTGRAEMAQVRSFDWGEVRLDNTALVSSAAAWRAFISDTTADLLVVLSTDGLPEPAGQITSAAQLIRWAQAHAEGLPIGTQIDFVPQGGALSFAPPPGVFGREAIRGALDWLDERHSRGAPAPLVIAHFDVGLRQSALASRGLRLPSIYSEAAREAGALYP